MLFCPTYSDGGDNLAARPETLGRIEEMTARHPELEAWVSTNNPYTPGNYSNVLYQYQLARSKVIGGDYRALLCFEHDMLPPVDGFERLDQAGAGSGMKGVEADENGEHAGFRQSVQFDAMGGEAAVSAKCMEEKLADFLLGPETIAGIRKPILIEPAQVVLGNGVVVAFFCHWSQGSR